MGDPQNSWFRMKNPLNIDDFEVPHMDWKPPHVWLSPSFSAEPLPGGSPHQLLSGTILQVENGD